MKRHDVTCALNRYILREQDRFGTMIDVGKKNKISWEARDEMKKSNVIRVKMSTRKRRT